MESRWLFACEGQRRPPGGQACIFPPSASHLPQTLRGPRHGRLSLLHRAPPPGPRDGPRFLPQPHRAGRPRARPDLDLPLGEHQGHGRARPPRRALERGARRRRDGPALVLHHHPRDGQGGREPCAHHQRAHQPRAPRPIVEFGTEEQRRRYVPLLASGTGARRVRPHRAGRGQRCRRHRHDRGGQGRPLPAQRLQDLHHPRRGGRDLLGHRPHRAGARATRASPASSSPRTRWTSTAAASSASGTRRTCRRPRASGRARRKTRWAGGRATPGS